MRLQYTEPLLLLFCLIGLVGWLRVRRSKGSVLVGLGLLGFFVCSWPPFDWLLSRPLEIWYPKRPFDPSARPQAIVVLSAYVESPTQARPYSLPDVDTYKRCEFAAWLYRHWQPLPVLACGGRARNRDEPYSVTMRRALERAGIPPGMLWTEERSHSTHENAIWGAQVLRLHGISSIALVVDATSMPRASASFRKAGIEVWPTPSEFREFESLQDELLPSWKAVRHNEVTLHESVGLAWYWLHGWI